jgi:hypothetical protein
MNTAIQELIHFIENDRMQSSYTKEQVIELLTFKLEKEKEQIVNAFLEGYLDDIPDPLPRHYYEHNAEQYYSETFK